MFCLAACAAIPVSDTFRHVCGVSAIAKGGYGSNPLERSSELLLSEYAPSSPIGSSLVSVADGTCPGGSTAIPSAARAFSFLSSTPADDAHVVASRGRFVTAQN